MTVGTWRMSLVDKAKRQPVVLSPVKKNSPNNQFWIQQKSVVADQKWMIKNGNNQPPAESDFAMTMTIAMMMMGKLDSSKRNPTLPNQKKTGDHLETHSILIRNSACAL